jgi:hypothetical protein
MNTPQERFTNAVQERRRATLEPGTLPAGDIALEPPITLTQFQRSILDRRRGSEVGGFERRFSDVGVIRAFTGGIKEGVLDPLTILGVETHPLRLDETGEHVANFLGNMVGLGISFVPFAIGAGAALRGLGFAATIARTGQTPFQIRKAQALFNFSRNVIAGTVQIAGTSEELADLPANIVIGATFGAAIEGLFLGKAFFGRRGKVNTSRMTDSGDPIGDVPFDLDTAAKEVTLAPNESQSASRVRTSLEGLFREERPYDEVMTLLAQHHVETVRLPGLTAEEAARAVRFANQTYGGGRPAGVIFTEAAAEVAEGVNSTVINQARKMARENPNGFFGNVSDDIEKAIRQNLGDDAATVFRSEIDRLRDLAVGGRLTGRPAKTPTVQVLTRSTQGGKVHEVLVHNPVDPADLLTAKQIEQWKKFGYAEGQEILYGTPAKSYQATGAVVAEGKIQLVDPLRPRTPFAVNINETTRPLATRFYNKSALREEALKRALIETEHQVGVTIPSATVGEGAALSAKRGLVDVSEYEVTTSLRAFLDKHKVALADITAPSQMEALAILTRNLGIKGLVIKEGGFTKAIHVFDQATVNFIKQPPRKARVSRPETIPPVEATGPRQQSILDDLAATAERIELENAARPRPIRPIEGAEPAVAALPNRGMADEDLITFYRDLLETGANVRGIAETELSLIGRGYNGLVRQVRNTAGPDQAAAVNRFGAETVLGDVPNVGLALDNAVTSVSVDGRTTILHSFEPSWKGSISAALRREGIPEKEIIKHLDLYASQVERRLEGLMDKEMLAIKNGAEIRFGECV